MGETKRMAHLRLVECRGTRAPGSPEGPRRVVTIDVTVRLTTDVPADWDDDEVKFWIEDSSLCAGSFVVDKLKNGGCGCDKIQGAKVVR